MLNINEKIVKTSNEYTGYNYIGNYYEKRSNVFFA